EKGDNMENNWKLHHVGVAIRDMDKTVEYYQSLGIATFEPSPLLSKNSFWGDSPSTG
ncbi:unnamed protein product, partial [marine sediment metagenome]